MPVMTLRPDATIAGGSNYAIGGGAGSLQAAVSDSSDTTYVYRVSSSGRTIDFSLGTQTLPAGAVVTGVSVTIRYSSTGARCKVFLYEGVAGDSSPFASLETPYNSSLGNYDSGTQPTTLSQSQIDGLKIQAEVTSSSGTDRIYELVAYVTYVTVPAAPTSITPTGEINNTLSPLVTWVHDATGGPQYRYNIKVFTNAVKTGGGFNPDSSLSAWEGLAYTSTQSGQAGPLSNGGTYWAYVRTANSVATGWSPWATSSTSFNINMAVGAPLNVTPAAGSIQPTSTPSLGATGPNVASPPTKRQWEFAADMGFTSFVRSIDEGIFRTNHDAAPPFPYPSSLVPLAQGTRYVRARFFSTIAGTWTTGQAFTVAHVPAAEGASPVGSAVLAYATTVHFEWIFSDPWEGDAQTAYQIEMWKNGLKATTLIDSGKVVSAVSVANVGTVNTTWKTVGLMWRVRVWDAHDVVSPWSQEYPFYLLDPPTVAVTSPANASVVTVPAPTVAWTFSSVNGVQDRYRVVVTNTTDSVVVLDSGVLYGTNTSWTPSTQALVAGKAYSVTVAVWDALGSTNTATNTFTATIVLPTTPIMTVSADSFDQQAKVLLDWSSSVVDTDNIGWRVYRRLVSETNWTEVYYGTNKFAEDYLSRANHVEYGVVQVNLAIGGLLESAKATKVVDLRNLAREYWLVVPDNPALNLELEQVTSDQFAEQREARTFNMIGRGRRQEVGFRYGVSGTLSAELRDTQSSTARQKRRIIEEIASSGLDAYLRTPFGDVWKIGMNSISLSRVPGVGGREHSTLSLGYQETL